MIDKRKAYSRDMFMRTLGFWQPYGSLMLNGKTETRIVGENRKPPFPIGKYLFYTTRQSTPNHVLFDWCGPDLMSTVIDANKDEPTANLNGYAIAIAELVSIRRMTKEDEAKCFIRYFGRIERKNKKGEIKYYYQQCLIFENIKRIEPFVFDKGKQGVGFIEADMFNKIKII